jgi:phytanoyl-CoA hydroxylase
MNLTPEQSQQYRDEGYLILPALIHGEKLAHYKRILDELVANAESMQISQGGYHLQPDAAGYPVPGRLFKVQGLCCVDERMLELAKEPAIVERVADLIGPRLHMFGSKFFPMLPRGGTSTGWHQDNHYFGTNSDEVVSCGIYLEDADHSNGCLSLLPRSHQSAELVEHAAGAGILAHGSWTEVNEAEALLAECPGGTVILFSANLLHGAGTNNSERSRYSTAWHYIKAEMDLEMFPFGKYDDRHDMEN